MFKLPQPYRIALVSPSGKCDRETVLAGKKMLEASGASAVKIMPHVFDGGTLSHLSAPDDQRAADINAAIADENIDLLWAVRGGAGALRILDKIDWENFRQHPKFFAGFSDITAIHWAMAGSGIDFLLAAPMMKFLTELNDEMSAKSLTDALDGKNLSLQCEALRPGEISGTPLPGNIAVAASLCGTRFFPDTAGKILILEEVGEAPYRLDRMLTQLRLAGAFDRCSGIIFGNFTDCGEVPGVMDILKDFTGQVTCPVFCGLPHGHEMPFFSVSGRQIISATPR